MTLIASWTRFCVAPRQSSAPAATTRHTFEKILAGARAALARLVDPEERLRTFIRLQLKFFLERSNEGSPLLVRHGPSEFEA